MNTEQDSPRNYGFGFTNALVVEHRCFPARTQSTREVQVYAKLTGIMSIDFYAQPPTDPKETECAHTS